MVELKLKSTVEETAEQLRINLEGIQNYPKYDDYLIDDECGGFYRTISYTYSMLRNEGALVVTLDNLMGYTRLHACGTKSRSGQEMEHSLQEVLHEFLL